MRSAGRICGPFLVAICWTGQASGWDYPYPAALWTPDSEHTFGRDITIPWGAWEPSGLLTVYGAADAVGYPTHLGFRLSGPSFISIVSFGDAVLPLGYPDGWDSWYIDHFMLPQALPTSEIWGASVPGDGSWLHNTTSPDNRILVSFKLYIPPDAPVGIYRVDPIDVQVGGPYDMGPAGSVSGIVILPEPQTLLLLSAFMLGLSRSGRRI